MGFSKKNNSKISELERECRSIILDRNLNIISYGYDDIYYNQDAKNYILKNGLNKNYTIQECFEGTLISVFNHNGDWYLSTRQCIDSKLSKWTSEKSHYEMFMECIDISFEEFTEHLKEDINYFFVIVHHENKNIVDYTEYFNDPEYKKIIHVMSRSKSSNLEIELCDENQWNKKPNFKIPQKLKDNENGNQVFELNNDDNLTLSHPDIFNDFEKLDNINKKLLLTLPVKSEGIIVRCLEETTGKLTILKFQTNSYQFMSLLKPNTNNIFMSFIELYQQDLLKKHIEYFPGNSKMSVSDINEISETYDTIGIVDASFKVLTSELFEIFKHLYDLKDCSHKNESFYKVLPNEYTIALYKIRGIYYRKKEKYIKNKNVNEETNYTYSLKIFDIYNLLKKKYDTKELLKLFRARKLIMAQFQNNTSQNGIILNNISNKCDKVSIKMTSILLNKMFPKDPELEIYSKNVIKKENYGLSQSI